ncbi:cytochrome P450 [Nodularia harveyana UHCC-0300]|uniref:Cytochrome P450 n=1 Tax=Nodularia harveyana UHCC-0300 TaxID=2974287 RepID=A0A9E8AGH9_9CYAN|nr:cytochrome P450 [Nodularia harveyana]MEA5581853.1 cytochrome P450 [Nodularia harveyana UHCC-0300]UZC80149.1 PuwJ [Nodularia harveyana UHCC-0300]
MKSFGDHPKVMNNNTIKPIFNPFLPEFRTNPYPYYEKLRSDDPIHFGFMGVWIISRYADAISVLRDPRFSVDMRRWGKYKDIRFRETATELGPLGSMTSKWMLFMDPPDHTRLQRLVSKAFSPQIVQRLRPYIQEVVNQKLDEVQDLGKLDVIADLAQPLPVVVIAEMLGIPRQDRDQLQKWSDDVVLCLDPMMSIDVFERLNKVVIQFTEYFRNLIVQRRQQPEDDLLSDLIAARDEQDKLTEEELLGTCILLFAAGHETTVKLISNGILSLLRHPDQMAKLQQEPALIQSAVEEFLRYDSPVQLTVRTAIKDIEIGGKTIRQGQQVFVCLGSAHRDSEQFPDADQLDITRQNNQHLGFSYGIHACLGNVLARVQAQIAINTLMQRCSNLQLATDKLEWQKKIILRGLKELPVTFTNNS